VAIAVGAAACGGSGYEYVHNRDEGVYFKVPSEWTRYEGEQLLATRADLQQQSLLDFERDAQREWLVGFDASPSSTPENVFNPTATAPRGFVSVRELGRDERDTINLSALRKVNFPFTEDGEQVDPVEYVRDNPDGPILIHDHGELVLDDGTHAYVVVAEIAGGPGAEATYMFQQIVAINAELTKQFVIIVGCTAICYRQNADVIGEVIGSWGLEDDA
jgi:hypothetical protein